MPCRNSKGGYRRDVDNGVTLVIGGMGVKGVSNVGALQALQAHGIRVKRIIASGISSIVAAQFSLGWNLDALTEHFTRFFTGNDKYLWGLEQLAGFSFRRTRRVRDSFSYFLRERLYCQANFKRVAILDWDSLEGDLLNFFGDVTLSDLRIPVAISAIDLGEMEEVLLEDDPLVTRLKAGIAFPGLLPPVLVGRRTLVGSTFYCELPLAKVAVNDSPVFVIDTPTAPRTQHPGNVVEMLARIDEIRSAAIKRGLIPAADRVFVLEGLKGFQWGNYRQIPQQVDRARQEMDYMLSRLGPW